MAAPIRRRTRARELTLQFLYTLELRGEAALDDAQAFIHHHTRRGPDPKGQAEVADYAMKLIQGVWGNLATLNEWIEHIAQNWRLDRMAHIDRNILRMAIYELLHETDVPFKVVINEAIDIAKRFSTGQSGSFVNGILDRARVLITSAREEGDELPRPPKHAPLPSKSSKDEEPDPPAPTPRPRPRAVRPEWPKRVPSSDPE